MGINIGAIGETLGIIARGQETLQNQFTPQPEIYDYLQFFNEEIVTCYSGTKIEIDSLYYDFRLTSGVDTASGYITTNNAGSKISIWSGQPFTVELWVKGPWDVDSYMIHKTSEYGLSTMDIINGESTGSPCFYVRNTAGSNIVVLGNSSALYSPGYWYHMAGIYDSGSIYLYINGSFLGSKVFSGTPNTGSNDMLVGGEPGIYEWLGSVDEIRLSRKARYTGNYNPGSLYLGNSDTLLHWHLDEGTGSITQDISSNNIDGSLIGACWTNGGLYSGTGSNVGLLSYSTNQGSRFLDSGLIVVRDLLIEGSSYPPTTISLGSGAFAWHGSLTHLGSLWYTPLASTVTRAGEGVQYGSFIVTLTGSVLTSGIHGNREGSYFLRTFNGTVGSITSGVGFTVEGWFKGLSGAGVRVSRSSTVFDWAIGVNIWGATPQGSLAFYMYDGFGGDFYTATSPITDENNWHHIAGIYDNNGSMYIYKDGSLAGSSFFSSTILTTPSEHIHVGAKNLNVEFWTGSADEIRISNVRRYTSNFIPSTLQFTNDSDTLLLWHFNENSGPRTRDDSNHGGTGSFFSGEFPINPSYSAWTDGHIYSLIGSNFSEIGIFNGSNLLTYDTFPAQSLNTGNQIRFVSIFRIGS